LLNLTKHFPYTRLNGTQFCWKLITWYVRCLQKYFEYYVINMFNAIYIYIYFFFQCNWIYFKEYPLIFLNNAIQMLIVSVYLCIHFGTATIVPEDFVLGVHVFRKRILYDLNYLWFIKVEWDCVLLIRTSVLLQHGLMSLSKPCTRCHEYTEITLAIVVWWFALSGA